jgi:hypothetical protein
MQTLMQYLYEHRYRHIYANVSQLVCLSNLENLNAVFINDKLPQAERLTKLNHIAIHQMKILVQDNTPKLNPKSN